MSTRTDDKSLEPAVELLRTAAAALDTPLDDESIRRFERYVTLLIRWNRVFNLTAITEPSQIVIRHVLDSLAIAPLVRGPRLLDIGSGAGLPGIPLAIACPTLDVTLLESRGKRARFLQTVLADLQLDLANVVETRVEQYRPNHNFDTLTARAVAPLDRMFRVSGHLWRKGTRIVMMKGEFPAKELKDLEQHHCFAPQVISLKVPHLDAKRHAVVIDIEEDVHTG